MFIRDSDIQISAPQFPTMYTALHVFVKFFIPATDSCEFCVYKIFPEKITRNRASLSGGHRNSETCEKSGPRTMNPTIAI